MYPAPALDAAIQCTASAGCDAAEKYAQLVKSNFPSETNANLGTISGTDRSGQTPPMEAHDAFPVEFLPGVRFGAYSPPSYHIGIIYANPRPGISSGTAKWLRPDTSYCNPLGGKAIYKLAISHTGVPFYTSSGVVFTKMAVCLNAICAANDASCAPKK